MFNKQQKADKLIQTLAAVNMLQQLIAKIPVAEDRILANESLVTILKTINGGK